MTETNPVTAFNKTHNAERCQRYRVKQKMKVNQQQTPIDVKREIERKRKKAEYNKQYRLK